MAEPQTLSWLKAHERIVIVFMCLLVLGFIGNKYINYEADQATSQATVAAQVAAEAKSSAEKAAQASALTSTQYQSMVDTLTRQNQALAQAITSRDSVLGQKVTEVSKPKAPTVVASDVNEAYKGSAPSVVTDSGITFDPTVVQKFTVTKLERDAFQANLSDETQVASNLKTELDKSNQLSGTLNVQVSSLNNQIVTQGKQCAADIKLVKAESRKGKVKWFKVGYVMGLVSGLWLGHAVGL